MSAARGTPPSTRRSPGPSKSANEALQALPPERLLPDGQPTYVASWIYVFGVASIASLIVIIGSGCILALKGPAWWHETGVGHFFNSIHLWSVELFFFAMVVHLWGKYWMAAWRGGRGARVGHRRDHLPGRGARARSPATSPSRTSTPSGSPRRPRTR